MVNLLLTDMDQSFQRLKLQYKQQETNCREKEEMQNLCAANGRTEQCCGEHRRRLELFCQEDEAFVCVLCVPKHPCHSFVLLNEVAGMYKDVLESALSSLELKVFDLKNTQVQNEMEMINLHANACSLVEDIKQEFAKLHQFLSDTEQKLIHQLKNEKEKIQKVIEESLECVKNSVMSTQETMTDDNLVLIKQEPVDVLTVPATFEDVAVTFSEAEWKLLRKQDKELHKEVMVQNYETLVSVGYKIPPEKLLLLLKSDYDELQKDVEGKKETEEKDNHEEKLSIRSTEWGVGFNQQPAHQQPALRTSLLHHLTENLQHSTQLVKDCNSLHPTPVPQPYTENKCSKTYPFGTNECNMCFSQSCHVMHQSYHMEEKPYKCAECSKCFLQRCDMIHHQAMHTKQKRYKCPECSKYFSRRNLLRRHQTIHTGERPYKCSECSKSYRTKSGFMYHQNTHTGEKTYKCTKCSKCFLCVSSLKSHQTTHTGEKPYKCSECSKCFSRNSNLMRHYNIHTGVKPYKCSECSKCFSYSSTMKYHQTLHKKENGELKSARKAGNEFILKL